MIVKAQYNLWNVNQTWGTSPPCFEIGNLSADYQSKRPEIFFFFFNLAASGVLVAAHEAATASCGVSPRASQALAVTRGLSCTVACGIFVPWPGIESASSALQGKFLTTGPPGRWCFFKTSSKLVGWSRSCHLFLTTRLSHLCPI